MFACLLHSKHWGYRLKNIFALIEPPFFGTLLLRVCGLWTHSVSITLEFVKSVDSQAPLQAVFQQDSHVISMHIKV